MAHCYSSHEMINESTNIKWQKYTFKSKPSKHVGQQKLKELKFVLKNDL